MGRLENQPKGKSVAPSDIEISHFEGQHGVMITIELVLSEIELLTAECFEQ